MSPGGGLSPPNQDGRRANPSRVVTVGPSAGASIDSPLGGLLLHLNRAHHPELGVVADRADHLVGTRVERHDLGLAASARRGRCSAHFLAGVHEPEVVSEVTPVLERDGEPARAAYDDPLGIEGVFVADDTQLLARGNGQSATPPGVVLVAAAERQQRAHDRQDDEQAHGDGILCAAVSRGIAYLCVAAAAVLAGCGGKIEVPEEQTAAREGAELFNERCSGCHSLEVANAYGSKAAGQIEGGERTNGPDFNVRKVSKDDALFAIRNGGFSGAIMPANIVVGRDAELVAAFLARYSGGKGP
jgi:hypothetical protein